MNIMFARAAYGTAFMLAMCTQIVGKLYLLSGPGPMTRRASLARLLPVRVPAFPSTNHWQEAFSTCSPSQQRI